MGSAGCGAGWIGSEVAASARQMGAEVILIDPAPAPLHRVLGDEIGDVFRRLHVDNGVQLRLRSGVAEARQVVDPLPGQARGLVRTLGR